MPQTAQPETTRTTEATDSRVVEYCSELIRLDTTVGLRPERAAAEYVAARLSEAGLTPRLLEGARGRTNVVARMAGREQDLPPLLLHCHLDVVPADPAGWSVHPFSGEVAGGYVWGRGAVDMKDMVAMTLDVVATFAESGRGPRRDVVLAFVADEEQGGNLGAQWLVERHPDLFADCEVAIGEVGGFSVQSPQGSLYLLETAQKGAFTLELTARGLAGHGSMLNDRNALQALSRTVAAIADHPFPLQLTATTRTFLEQVGDAFGIEDATRDPDRALAVLGEVGRIVGATLRHTATPVNIHGGDAPNVVPPVARAQVDCRAVPGHEEDFLAELGRLIPPEVSWTTIPRGSGHENVPDTTLTRAVEAALLAEDPTAKVLPFCMSAATDARHFSRLGLACYGFVPLRLPADNDFAAMFHGTDERVAVESLVFGTRVLDRFLSTY
ncbi:M20/M25/M40 family metallo-hydrolase [Streptomyces sp. MUM 203J]|uniref:M20/M25/M40 family metallo-hydrolase n=1 Tax=Streptomyces sp. MUM 203J TaxID=2791990 RepID=UPI001F04D3FB|nr:M20/M25/M40 family metallo-hydrolase [Streptomyces sp. MUM 203J]MCH0539321.1 M20/M25/M40 family metallo-hydrolase [Streptomyces sp. MUM 203J]